MLFPLAIGKQIHLGLRHQLSADGECDINNVCFHRSGIHYRQNEPGCTCTPVILYQ